MTDNSPEKILPLSHDTPEDMNERSLPAARRDVDITEQVYYGKPCFVLKDPTTLRYYRLRPPEYAIYQMMDGKNTMDDVLTQLASRFPKEEFDAQAVMSFLIMLRGANLLIIPGDNTEYLLKRKNMMTRSLFKKFTREYLFFKIPVMDPDKLLNWLNGKVGSWLFTRTMKYLTWLMLFGAIWLLLTNIDNLGQRMPLLSPKNLLFLAPAMFLIKIIHEFGHGLTSKHFDTEVHEMGVLFLVFMPCMYCDVSDAWMLSEKRKRMWITAAGIVVEVLLAGIATYIWAFTIPGTVINQFALNIMLAASINTLLFNGNPLLRYDGYYFLMDLMELPNLKQKSQNYLWYLFQTLVLGVKDAQMPADVQGRELRVLGYALASALYRWFIMFAIVTMIWKFLDPYGFGVIGAVMAIASIYSAFIAPLVKFGKYLKGNHHRLRLHLASSIVLAALIISMVYGLMILPLEQTVDTQIIIRTVDLHPLYVTQPGMLDSKNNPILIRDGQQVKAGDILFVLSDPELRLKSEELNLQIEQLEIARDNAKSEEVKEGLMLQISALNESFSLTLDKIKRLTISSPIDGIVQIRTGEPLANLLDSFIPLQTELVAVYPDKLYEAVSVVSGRDIELVDDDQKNPQKVEIKLWAHDNKIIHSTVQDKPSAQIRQLSNPAFSAAWGGTVPTLPTNSIKEALEPAESTYELVFPLDQDELNQNNIVLQDGMSGQGRIIIEKKTVYQVVKRWFIRNLKLDFGL
ncbi:MAG: biotin/lipoyl-binding protein [Phycisphaerae bacterium]|nr:biotin/lipoyl-binding protein [Phycisphaerae bacterium]